MKSTTTFITDLALDDTIDALLDFKTPRGTMEEKEKENEKDKREFEESMKEWKEIMESTTTSTTDESEKDEIVERIAKKIEEGKEEEKKEEKEKLIEEIMKEENPNVIIFMKLIVSPDEIAKLVVEKRRTQIREINKEVEMKEEDKMRKTMEAILKIAKSDRIIQHVPCPIKGLIMAAFVEPFVEIISEMKETIERTWKILLEFRESLQNLFDEFLPLDGIFERIIEPRVKGMMEHISEAMNECLRSEAEAFNATGEFPVKTFFHQSSTTATQGLPCVKGIIEIFEQLEPTFACSELIKFRETIIKETITPGIKQINERFEKMMKKGVQVDKGAFGGGIEILCEVMGGALVMREELISKRDEICETPEDPVGPFVNEIEKLTEIAQICGDRFEEMICVDVFGMVISGIIQFPWQEERTISSSTPTPSIQYLMIILQKSFSQLQRFTTTTSVIEEMATRVVTRIAETMLIVFSNLNPSEERAKQFQRDCNATASILKSLSLHVNDDCQSKSIINTHLAMIASVGAIQSSSQSSLITSTQSSISVQPEPSTILSKLHLISPSMFLAWENPNQFHELQSNLETLSFPFDDISNKDAISFIFINNPKLFIRTIEHRHDFDSLSPLVNTVFKFM